MSKCEGYLHNIRMYVHLYVLHAHAYVHGLLVIAPGEEAVIAIPAVATAFAFATPGRQQKLIFTHADTTGLRDLNRWRSLRLVTFSQPAAAGALAKACNGCDNADEPET